MDLPGISEKELDVLSVYKQLGGTPANEVIEAVACVRYGRSSDEVTAALTSLRAFGYIIDREVDTHLVPAPEDDQKKNSVCPKGLSYAEEAVLTVLSLESRRFIESHAYANHDVKTQLEWRDIEAIVRCRFPKVVLPAKLKDAMKALDLIGENGLTPPTCFITNDGIRVLGEVEKARNKSAG